MQLGNPNIWVAKYSYYATLLHNKNMKFSTLTGVHIGILSLKKLMRQIILQRFSLIDYEILNVLS